MTEILIKIPEIKLDNKTRLKLKDDIRSVIRLRLARELMIKKLDKMLEKSTLTDRDCLILGDKVKEAVTKEWHRRGWL